VENFWSLLKRGLRGTYVSVEPYHLFRYLDEQAFRYNHRKHEDGELMKDGEGFAAAMKQIVGRRLTYKELTGKAGGRGWRHESELNDRGAASALLRLRAATIRILRGFLPMLFDALLNDGVRNGYHMFHCGLESLPRFRSFVVRRRLHAFIMA
jgi:hypothetical protein